LEEFLSPVQSGISGKATFIGQGVTIPQDIILPDFCMFHHKSTLNDLSL